MSHRSKQHTKKTIFVFFIILCVFMAVLFGCQTSPEKKKLHHYNKGIEYLQKNEIQSAILEFKNAIDIDSTFADAHYQLGAAYSKLREFDKAVIAFDNAAAHDPDNVEARLQVANFYYLRQRDFAKAQHELEEIIRDFPDNPQAYAALGAVHYAQENVEAAVSAFEKSLELEPGFVQAGITLGRIYLHQQRPEEAQKIFEHVLRQNPENVEILLAMATFYLETGQPERAQEYYDKILKLDAQNASAYLGLAEVALVQKHPAQALEILQQFKSTMEKDVPLELDLRIRFIAGRAYLFQGNFHEAVSNLQLITERLPGLLMGHYSYGLAQAGMGKLEQAITAYQRALNLDNQHIPSQLNLAIAYFKNGDLEEASESVQNVIKLAPDNVEALDLQGMISTKQGRYEEALTLFSQAEQIAKETSFPLEFFTQLSLHKAIALLNLQKADEVILELQNVLQEGQMSAEAYVHLAKAYMLKEAFQNAISSYKKAIELEPKYLIAYTELAKLYVAASQYSQAKEILEPILSQYADDINILYLLGRIDAGEGRLEQAKTRLQQVVQKNPAFVEAHYALAEIYQALKDGEGAIKEYEHVLDRVPEHVPSLINLAYINLRQGRYEEAILYANRALRLESENITALGILSSVYAQTQQFDKAIEIIESIKTTYPDAPTIYISLGLVYLNQGKFDKAIEASQKAIQLDSENPVPYHTIGRAYIGKQKFAQAEQYFQKTLEIEPLFVRAYVKLGQLDLARKEYFKALHYFQQAIEIQPDYDEAFLELGKIYRIQQRYDEAIAAFEHIKESSPYFRYTLEPLIELYNLRNEYNKVISLASKYLKVDDTNAKIRYLLAQGYAKRGDMDNAAATFREITLSAPDFGQALVDLGFLYLAQNRFDSALTQFEEATQFESLKVEASIGKTIANQLLQDYQNAVREGLAIIELAPENQLARFVLGNVYISQKSFPDAVEQFQQMTTTVLESFVTEPELRSYYGDQAAVSAAYYNLGMICTSKHWLQFAKEAYNTALWRTPQNPLLPYAMGKVHSLSSNYRSASGSYEKVLELAPELFYVYKVLGDMYQKQKDFDQALQAYQQYLSQKPDDVDVRLFVGILYEKTDQPDKAIAEYQRIIESDPDNPIVLNQLAWAYAEQGEQFDEALEFAQRAVSLSADPGIIDTLGWVFYKRGEYAEAIEQFQQALQKSPFQPMIKYHLGLASYHNGDKALAQETFEEVLTLAKDFEYATEIRQLLEKNE